MRIGVPSGGGVNYRGQDHDVHGMGDVHPLRCKAVTGSARSGPASSGGAFRRRVLIPIFENLSRTHKLANLDQIEAQLLMNRSRLMREIFTGRLAPALQGDPASPDFRLRTQRLGTLIDGLPDGGACAPA